ncbi:MAG: hypothetical protein K2G66_03630, partial [Alistipes sp.]|nr:hypothetical protein [Alistipes sp.]
TVSVRCRFLCVPAGGRFVRFRLGAVSVSVAALLFRKGTPFAPFPKIYFPFFAKVLLFAELFVYLHSRYGRRIRPDFWSGRSAGVGRKPFFRPFLRRIFLV